MGVIERAIPDQDQYLEIRPGLFRCTKIMTIGFFALPIATFLIKGNLIPEEPEAHEWILIDAGAPQAEDLLENIKQVLKHPKDTIKYLCITHGHADHTGATTTILENYSECMVIAHPEEKPFLCDGKYFKSCHGDTQNKKKI